MPAPKIIRPTPKAEIYSMRPWPYGCSRSGARPASFAPTIVTTEDIMSVALLIASKMIAKEFDRNPTMAFAATNARLVRMPKMLVFIMVFCLFIR